MDDRCPWTMRKEEEYGKTRIENGQGSLLIENPILQV
jgi:hypothetical protein